jgi:hypothetical protein
MGDDVAVRLLKTDGRISPGKVRSPGLFVPAGMSPEGLK